MLHPRSSTQSHLHLSLLVLILSLTPFTLAQTPQYNLTNMTISQITFHPHYTQENFTLAAKGLTPGSLWVNCSLSWNASEATGNKDVSHQFNCSDPAVNITLERIDLNPMNPFYLYIELNSANLSLYPANPSSDPTEPTAQATANYWQFHELTSTANATAAGIGPEVEWLMWVWGGEGQEAEVLRLGGGQREGLQGWRAALKAAQAASLGGAASSVVPVPVPVGTGAGAGAGAGAVAGGPEGG